MTKRNVELRQRCVSGRRMGRRGIALLLVLMGLVICSVLVAGFLGTQGTSLGIARNERDAAKCRSLARGGVDMCFWLVRNRPDWRTTMRPGMWLENVPLGDGTITVQAADGDGGAAFADDPTQPLLLWATGRYDGRAFTLTATIQPTGGGAVFADGNVITGNIKLGNPNLEGAVVVDSYNSSVAAYNPLVPGVNNRFTSNDFNSAAMLIYFPTIFRGAFAAGPGGDLGNVVKLVGNSSGPVAVSIGPEPRVSGAVIFPNTAGLAYQGTMSSSGAALTFTVPGIYDEINASDGTINIATSGTYYIRNQVTLGATSRAVLNIMEGVTARIIVGGDVTLNAGKIVLQGNSSRLELYVQGSVRLNDGSINENGDTARFSLFGDSKNDGCIEINDSHGALNGAVYAPRHHVSMSTNSPRFFGAVRAKYLTLEDSSAFHFDEALRTKRIANITGGSAPSDGADYRITITGGPGILR